jgi:ribosomal protein S18 acetylase RimI-like enzyme
MEIVESQLTHMETLMSWFPDQKSGYLWCGPGLRYPFTRDSFLEDARWGAMPAYSLIDPDNNLLGFGQYYEKVGRCHLARLVVSPSVRGKGVGYGFISELMKIGMIGLETDECSLFVLNYNVNALKCYQALGFKKAEYPPDHKYFSDIDFMVKKIRD